MSTDAIHLERHAWLVLLRAPGLGPARLRALIARCGNAVDALAQAAALQRELDLPDAALAWLRAPEPALLARDHAWLAAPDHQLLTCDDADFPALLREIPSAPAALFVVGAGACLWTPQIAIVGSRNATAAGLASTRTFAKALSQAGFTVTSGLADGVDGVAHAAALDADGATIAVMGTGPDLIYPRKHHALAQRIAQNGALVSEFAPGTPGRAEHFPRRNRIIAGLSLGTLVIEASLKSGSLITARLANEQGREVFALPGSIHNPLARGCHRLIRDGAQLVETVDEIVTALAPLARSLGSELAARLATGAATAAVTATGWRQDPEYRRVLDALGHDPVGHDELGERTGFSAAALSSMLLMLELEGLITGTGGGQYQRVGAQ